MVEILKNTTVQKICLVEMRRLIMNTKMMMTTTTTKGRREVAEDVSSEEKEGKNDPS